MHEQLDALTNWFDSLYGIPGVGLTLLVCLACGYFLKAAGYADGRSLMRRVVLCGIVLNTLFRPFPRLTGMVWEDKVSVLVQHFGRGIAVGFIIAIVACVLYDKCLKRLEEKFPWLARLTKPPADS